MNQSIINDYHDYLSSEERKSLEDIFSGNFKKITETLNLEDDYPSINYYLYPSEEIKIQETGEDGFAEADCKNYKIFMVYNKDIQPIGPHELVHILTHKLGNPNFVFSEGLAEYFEDFWKAKVNGVTIRMTHDDWVRKFVEDGEYVSINTLFDDLKFWEADETALKSYPESGSFIKYLAIKYGLDKVMKTFCQLQRRFENKDYNYSKFEEIFGLKVSEAEEDWLKSINK